ncbi:MAG: ABC transporter permease [Acidobacteria bacterium]|nr:ABC transporter permease [Acidobacteriota bacterium]
MLWDAILLALSAIRRNVMRSTLTVLGIVIGVAAVIIMVTLGNGATARVTSEISSLGANMLMVMPGQERRGMGGGMREEAKLFEASDVEALRDEVPGVSAVAPTASKSMQVIYGNTNWSTTVNGVDNAYLQVRNWTLASGRAFSEAELSAGGAACILGATVRKQLFGTQDPIGVNVRLQAISCQVVAVLESKGQAGMGMDQDDLVLTPLRTFQRRISGNRYISSLLVGMRAGSISSAVVADVQKLLRQRRKIQPQQEDDFMVRDPQELISTLTGTTQLLTMLLGAVAAVSLLVGGIGIMNIMLVSVTERTREIGVRLAIGAFEHDVMTQFLVEAVVLSSLGGAMGLTLGLLVSVAGAKALEVPFQPDMRIATIAFLFSAMVGVLFGFVPARKAAQLDPIEALRHE